MIAIAQRVQYAFQGVVARFPMVMDDNAETFSIRLPFGETR